MKLLLSWYPKAPDKVVINTHAINNPDFITEASLVFGSQCIVISVDAKKNNKNEFIVFCEGGTKDTGLKVQDWVETAEQKGAGEILINSIDNDGLMNGYNIDLIKLVVGQTKSIPVIALGGAGVLQDIVDIYYEAKPAAIAMSSIFHFTDNKPVKANAYAIENGIDARII